MKQFYLSILMTVIYVSVFAQTEATTVDGKKIIIFPDGTWKEKEMQSDSVKVQHDLSDCNYWIAATIDKMTGESSTHSTNNLIISNDGAKTGIVICSYKVKTALIIMYIYPYGAGSCIEVSSKVNILFTDGSKLELNHDGEFNCKQTIYIGFGGIFGKGSKLNELKTKKIQTMRVWTNDGYVERDFTEENQNEFLGVINCLTK